MGHASTPAERGNDRLITVHAPFVVLAIAPNLNGEITRDNQGIGRELIALSLQATFKLLEYARIRQATEYARIRQNTPGNS